MVVLMLMVVAAAGALAVIVVMVVLMLMLVAAAGVLAIFVVMVVLMMLVAAAGALAVIVVMAVLMLMLVAAAGVLAVIVVMAVLMMLVFKFLHLRLQTVFVHGLEYLCAADPVKLSCDESGVGIEPAQHSGSSLYPGLRYGIGTAHDDEVGVLHLIVEELAEIAHIHAALAGVDDGHLRAYVRALNAFNGPGHVGQLAYARRLDEYAVRRIVVHNFFERLGEVAHQRAADTAGVHLGDLHSGVLQEASVNGDLAELVFDKDELPVPVAFINKLTDQRGLSGAEKAGENVYSCHG